MVLSVWHAVTWNRNVPPSKPPLYFSRLLLVDRAAKLQLFCFRLQNRWNMIVKCLIWAWKAINWSAKKCIIQNSLLSLWLLCFLFLNYVIVHDSLKMCYVYIHTCNHNESLINKIKSNGDRSTKLHLFCFRLFFT